MLCHNDIGSAINVWTLFKRAISVGAQDIMKHRGTATVVIHQSRTMQLPPLNSPMQMPLNIQMVRKELIMKIIGGD